MSPTPALPPAQRQGTGCATARHPLQRTCPGAYPGRTGATGRAAPPPTPPHTPPGVPATACLALPAQPKGTPPALPTPIRRPGTLDPRTRRTTPLCGGWGPPPSSASSVVSSLRPQLPRGALQNLLIAHGSVAGLAPLSHRHLMRNAAQECSNPPNHVGAQHLHVLQRQHERLDT